MSRFELLQILAPYSGPQNPKHDCKGIPVAPHMAGCLGDQREYSFLEKELGPTNCHSHPLTRCAGNAGNVYQNIPGN